MKTRNTTVSLCVVTGMLVLGCGGGSSSFGLGNGISAATAVPSGFTAWDIDSKGRVLLTNGTDFYKWTPGSVNKYLFTSPFSGTDLHTNAEDDVSTGNFVHFVDGSSGDFPGYNGDEFVGLNDAEQAFTMSGQGGGGAGNISFIWEGDEYTNLKSKTLVQRFNVFQGPVNFDFRASLNNKGEFAYSSSDSSVGAVNPLKATLVSGGTVSYLQAAGASSTYATSINDNSVVTGGAIIANVIYPCVWVNKVATVYQNMPGDEFIGCDGHGNLLGHSPARGGANYFLVIKGKVIQIGGLSKNLPLGTPIKLTTAGRLLCTNAVVDLP